MEAGVMAEALAARGLMGAGEWRRLPSTENVSYRIEVEGADLVVRASPAAHRTLDEVVDELRWVEALGAAGVDVVRAVAGHPPFAMVDEEGEQWTVALFGWVEGVPSPPGLVDVAHVERWGRLLGHIHAARLPDGAGKHRSHWRDTRNLDVARHFADWSGADRARASGLLDAVEVAGEERLLHGDLGMANLAGDSSRPVAIDFDDACFGPVAYDVGAALYDLAVDHGPEVPIDPGDAATTFVAGYRRAHPLRDEDIADLSRLWPAFVVERSVTARRLGVADDEADGRTSAFLRSGVLPAPLIQIDRRLRP